MTRPSRNIDRDLIRAGRELLRHHGVTDLSLRQVALKAKANLGMFHYHFKTKDHFVRAVLGDLYEEFFGLIEAEFRKRSAEKDPLSRFRGMLQALGRFAVDQRELMASVFRDVLSGNPEVWEVASANFPRHLTLLQTTIAECQKKGLIRKDLTASQIIVLCLSSLNLPTILGTALSRASKSGVAEEFLNQEFLTAKAIEKRIDFILRGLSP